MYCKTACTLPRFLTSHIALSISSRLFSHTHTHSHIQDIISNDKSLQSRRQSFSILLFLFSLFLFIYDTVQSTDKYDPLCTRKKKLEKRKKTMGEGLELSRERAFHSLAGIAQSKFDQAKKLFIALVADDSLCHGEGGKGVSRRAFVVGCRIR